MKPRVRKHTRSAKPVEDLASTFVEAVQATIGPMLSTFGFTKEKSQKDGTAASCLYGKMAAYVELTISLHPLDYPQSCNVVLGDGLREWPEKDWNGVALWRLGNALPAAIPVSNYQIDAFSDIPALVAHMRQDLERVGGEFLRGELEVFKRVRAEVNRAREPYKIHHPNGDGTYHTEGDPECIALKSRFS
jgi:hypothetical protein